MKIGVTGGNGFIGSHVTDALLSAGHSPVIFDRRSIPKPWRTEVQYFLGDVTDPVAMSELGKHVDGIIHLAACLGTQETIKNPRPAAQTNLMGGLNFLEACAENSIPGTYIGVGNWWMDNTYSISKTMIERFVNMFNAYNGTVVNIVRAVNAYGPRQSVAPPYGPAKVRKITPAFVCRALLGESIEVYGDGDQISDMVHVRDVARALVLALEDAEGGLPLRSPVEVGPAEHMTVNQIAETVREVVTDMGGPEQPRIGHLPMRPGEIPHAKVTADPETLRLVGMDPAKLIPFSGGIRETVQWFAQNWLPGYISQLDTLDDTALQAAV
jgi:nucleoside-diphosphate-sugar epimerase